MHMHMIQIADDEWDDRPGVKPQRIERGAVDSTYSRAGIVREVTTTECAKELNRSR
jgi:hypothetical protein